MHPLSLSLSRARASAMKAAGRTCAGGVVVLVTVSSLAVHGVAQEAGPTPAPGATSQPPVEEITVTAARLNAARNNIEPQTGASTYTTSSDAIQAMPGGDTAPIDQVILQAPGVAQDNLANGGLHVRDEHLNVQYRIDGVVLPDGVSFFGENLSPLFVGSMQLITGALPAEYGLRTAGIVDIQSKSGVFEPGGSVGIYGGSYGTLTPNAEYAGSSGGYSYFLSGDYNQSDHGVNAVTSAYNAIHDGVQQGHGFGYIDKIIDASSKISAMGGIFNSAFQIPNNPGVAPFGGISAINNMPISAFNSANLNEYQTETSEFAAVSYLRSEEYFDYQISVVSKYSALQYYPDSLGDLAFNGISQAASRSSFANDLQGEGTYRLTPAHTLRGGVLLSEEHVTSDTNSAVLPQTSTDAMGNPIFGTTPFQIVLDSQKTAWNYSAFAQDEWKVVPTVTVNYGGRFDMVNGYTRGNQISPRINTVWQATPSTTVHAGYARYFTPPPNELVATNTIVAFANTSAAPPSTINSPIQNERAHYFDAGVTQDLLPGLKAGVDAYYKISTNLIDEGQFGAAVVETPFNYRIAHNAGVELTTSYTNGGFTYYGNLAIAEQKAKGIDSAQFVFYPADLAYSASHFIYTDHTQFYTASAGMSYLWDGTTYSVDMLYGSGLRTTLPGGNINGASVPPYEQVNLGVSHVFADAPGGALTVRLDLINALDEVYLLRAQTGIGVFANQYGPRRTLYAGISKKF